MEGIHVHSGLSDWIGSAEGAMDAFPEPQVCVIAAVAQVTLRETPGLWMNDGLMKNSCNTSMLHLCSGIWSITAHSTLNSATLLPRIRWPRTCHKQYRPGKIWSTLVDFGVVNLFQSGWISCSAYLLLFHPLPALAASTWAGGRWIVANYRCNVAFEKSPCLLNVYKWHFFHVHKWPCHL